MRPRYAVLCLSIPLLLAGCGPAPDPQAAAAARAAADERAAEQMARDFEAQYAAQRWDLARAHGDVLIAQYPDSAAARGIADHYREAKARADEARTAARLAGLWTYQSQPVGKGEQLSAAIYSREPIDTGAGRSPVRLIFRDHPEWGRSSYLVLENGDFDCYGGCRVAVQVDGKARTMAASRPKTDEAIAMFIEDEKALWRAVGDADIVTITVPLKSGGSQDAVFEVGGLDPARMPGW